MLLLTRKAGEGIFAGDDIEFVVLSVNKGQVKIGINAPKDVVILRSELQHLRSKKGEGEGVEKVERVQP